MHSQWSHRIRLSFLAATVMALAACGGGGDSGSSNGGTTPPVTPPSATAAGYTVRAFSFTDANNYRLRYYYSSNVVDSVTGLTSYYDERVGRSAGAPVAANVLYDTALYESATGWQTFSGATVNTQTEGSPYTTTWGGYAYNGTRVDTDVSGQTLSSVVLQTQDLSVNTVSTTPGVNAAGLSGTLPAGAKLRTVTVTSTTTPVQYRVADGTVSGVSTLAGLIAAYPTPASPTAVNTASMARLHSTAGCGMTLCPAEALRVSFGATGVANFYLCDYDTSNFTTTNCTAAGSGNYALGTAIDGVTPIMTFSGLPASTSVQAFTRVFVQRNGVIYYGWKDKLSTATTTRLNKAAFEALAVALGIPAPTIDSAPSAYAGSWSAAYVGGDTGSCASVSIDATGYILGSCTSTGLGGTFIVSGQVSSTGVASFVASGGTSSGAGFSGSFTSTAGSGPWTQPSNSISGTWTAVKH